MRAAALTVAAASGPLGALGPSASRSGTNGGGRPPSSQRTGRAAAKCSSRASSSVSRRGALRWGAMRLAKMVVSTRCESCWSGKRPSSSRAQRAILQLRHRSRRLAPDAYQPAMAPLATNTSGACSARPRSRRSRAAWRRPAKDEAEGSTSKRRHSSRSAATLSLCRADVTSQQSRRRRATSGNTQRCTNCGTSSASGSMSPRSSVNAARSPNQSNSSSWVAGMRLPGPQRSGAAGPWLSPLEACKGSWQKSRGSHHSRE
mmetsp:Transcript_61929/g.171636  ORF Transcript_61929/g.171636 Transcript_61929/m.171636 type:complete len:260 (-) Transcript_61929:388-1167(-)